MYLEGTWWTMKQFKLTIQPKSRNGSPTRRSKPALAKRGNILALREKIEREAQTQKADATA